MFTSFTVTKRNQHIRHIRSEFHGSHMAAAWNTAAIDPTLVGSRAYAALHRILHDPCRRKFRSCESWDHVRIEHTGICTRTKR